MPCLERQARPPGPLVSTRPRGPPLPAISIGMWCATSKSKNSTSTHTFSRARRPRRRTTSAKTGASKVQGCRHRADDRAVPAMARHAKPGIWAVTHLARLSIHGPQHLSIRSVPQTFGDGVAVHDSRVLTKQSESPCCPFSLFALDLSSRSRPGVPQTTPTAERADIEKFSLNLCRSRGFASRSPLSPLISQATGSPLLRQERSKIFSLSTLKRVRYRGSVRKN